MNSKEIVDYYAAGNSCFWVTTSEPRRATTLIKTAFDQYKDKKKQKVEVFMWDCTKKMSDPNKPLQELDNHKGNAILFLRNYHWFVTKPLSIQNIQNRVENWKARGKAVIVLAPTIKIPAELEKDFMPVEFDLPGEEELEGAVAFIAKSAKKTKPEGIELRELVNAAKGLTVLETENALALSLIREKRFDPNLIAKQKAALVKRNGLLEVVETEQTFKDIRGYEQIKKFVLGTINSPLARGILILGPPGCGKTLFMKCLVGETDKLGLILDFGKMYSKFQGEADSNVRNAIKVIKAVGTCIVMVDEFEKQFAGAGSTGELDSGVTRRITGRWLEFMQERPPGVYIIGTCNSISGIPPEYFRPGRWDTAPFFIDLPTDDEKIDILKYWAEKYDVGLVSVNGGRELYPSSAPNMVDWTGAEIEACCRIAKMMNLTLHRAGDFILPQAKTMKEEIKRLREWSEGRTIPATKKLPKIELDEELLRKINV